MAGTAFGDVGDVGDVGAPRLPNAYFVVQSSTGVVLCSTIVVQSSTL